MKQKLKTKDNSNLRILVHFTDIDLDDTVYMYEIVCEHKCELTKIELSQIIIELGQFVVETCEWRHVYDKVYQVKKSKRRFELCCMGDGKIVKILDKLTEFETIPSHIKHQPYLLYFEQDFDVVPMIKSECRRIFETSKLAPCKFMQDYKRPCNILNTKDVKIMNDKKKQEIILKHLINFDHFEYFGNKKPICPYNNNDNCIHFQNVLNNKHSSENNFDEYFEDHRHLYLYIHKPSKLYMVNENEEKNGTSIAMFDYANASGKMLSRDVTHDTELFESEHYAVMLVIQEVISNGYEQELLKRSIDGNRNISGAQYVTILVNRYENNQHKFSENFDSIRNKLKEYYGIFDILHEKMNHQRHKEMDCPLTYFEMLCLILYCNGMCNHSLCQSQRDGSVLKKWPLFDVGVHTAIGSLSDYEIHDENIYTGIAGVFLDINKLYTDGDKSVVLQFKSNVSFTRDLNVARQFRGSDGLILGVNLHRLWTEFVTPPSACDISWISSFETEQEILVENLGNFRIYASKSYQIDKKQWFVCNVDQEITFESMFLANNNVLS